MVHAARRTVLLADCSKIGHVDVARVCSVTDLSLVVTGRSAPAPHLQALADAGVDVLVAPESDDTDHVSTLRS
jgi:DeoR/GlpR family transcriptional regulator of sugar metabolism